MSWKSTTVEAAFEFVRNGKSVQQDKSGDGLPITRIETISNWRINPNRVGFAGIHEAGNEKWLLQKGDILFSHINSVDHIGKCAVYEGTPEKLIHGMNLLAMRPRAGVLDPKFAYYALSRNEFRKAQAQFVNKAVNQASISSTNLKSLQFPLPPFDEQRRIAAILDQADDLRRKRRAVIERLQKLDEALLNQFLGPTTERSSRWKHEPLGDFALVRSGAGFPIEDQGRSEGRFPFYKVSDMNLVGNEQWMIVANNYIEEDVRKRLRAEAFPAETIIFPKIGAAIATNKKRILSTPACVDNNVMAVTAGEKVLPVFLYALFKKKDISEFAQPGNPPSMRKGDVEDWLIPIPPLSLQRNFAARVAEIDKLKAHHHVHLAKLDVLFASLQHRAFRGEL